MRVRLAPVALLFALSASPALADKPKLTIVSASPASQSESCTNQAESGCKVSMGPKAGDVTITWKANHGGEATQFYVAQTDGVCDRSKKFESIDLVNPYLTKETVASFTLKHDAVKELAAPAQAETTDKTFFFKLCFEGEKHSHPESAQNQETAAVDAKTDLSIAVIYDGNSPKVQSEALDVGGLNKALRLSWQASESTDVLKYRIYVDDRCQKDVHDKNEEALNAAIEASYSGDRREKLRQTFEAECKEPTAEDPPEFVDVDAPDTTVVLTRFKGGELREDSVYFFKLYAIDRAANEGGPVVGVGNPIPAIGPKEIFPGDSGCSMNIAAGPVAGGIDGSWAAVLLGFGWLRRKR